MPTVSLDRDLLNDYIYRSLALIDISLPDPNDLGKARKILLEMSQYIIQATVQEGKERPSIRKGR